MQLVTNHAQDNRAAISNLKTLSDKLSSASKVLIIGVGGGGDAISSLMILPHLNRDFNFLPDHIQVAAMLPDVLTYSGLKPIIEEVVSEITPKTERLIGDVPIKAFPEPLLAEHKDSFNVKRVIGLGMSGGSVGLAEALDQFIEMEKFDLVLACDVGGDFIATPQNTGVLSPMMDSYALSALREVQAKRNSLDLLYCVFGLGSDGESTPDLLRSALSNIEILHQDQLDNDLVRNVSNFYRAVIQPNRFSRTTDYTLRRVSGEILSPVKFTARFHTHPKPREVQRYYGEFAHIFDNDLLPRYYLFEDLSRVRNPFELKCLNGIEWFLGTQTLEVAINHELNGQSYDSLQQVLGIKDGNKSSIFFGTPSFRFDGEQRVKIIGDVLQSITNQVYGSSLLFTDDIPTVVGEDLSVLILNQRLSLVENRAAPLSALAKDRLIELARSH